jgi:hypothetical protein
MTRLTISVSSEQVGIRTWVSIPGVASIVYWVKSAFVIRLLSEQGSESVLNLLGTLKRELKAFNRMHGGSHQESFGAIFATESF